MAGDGWSHADGIAGSVVVGAAGAVVVVDMVAEDAFDMGYW